MSLPWFRMYHRIIDDEKIRLLAFEDRWHFVAICCLKVRVLDEISRRLAEVGLIDGHLNPVAWDELQYKSDSSTKRVQDFRKRQKEQPRNRVKRSRNVSVTAQETDTDTEVLEPKGSCASDNALKPEHIVEKWNLVAPRIGRPSVRDLTPERRQLTKARIAQYSLDDFMSVFAKVENSAFLRGDLKWKGVTFDWIMKKGNFQKIIEGNYDD